VVEASGRTATQASQSLRMRLQDRTRASGHGELTAMSRISDAATLWAARMDEMAADGRRSPGTVETYRRQLRNHVLPALGEVRLGEVTTPLASRQGHRLHQAEGELGHCEELPQRVLGSAR